MMYGVRLKYRFSSRMFDFKNNHKDKIRELEKNLCFLFVFLIVEDPTDDCQAVRDYVDLCRCEQLNIFTPEKLKNGFTKELETELRAKLKIHKVKILRKSF